MGRRAITYLPASGACRTILPGASSGHHRTGEGKAPAAPDRQSFKRRIELRGQQLPNRHLRRGHASGTHLSRQDLGLPSAVFLFVHLPARATKPGESLAPGGENNASFAPLPHAIRSHHQLYFRWVFKFTQGADFSKNTFRRSEQRVVLHMKPMTSHHTCRYGYKINLKPACDCPAPRPYPKPKRIPPTRMAGPPPENERASQESTV